MKCPNCKKKMTEDKTYASTISEPNWRERKGLKFVCDQHPYATELLFETNNELVKSLLRRGLLPKCLVNYQYVENGSIKKNWRS